MARRKTKEEFIKEAIAIYGDEYDYSETEYISTKHKVKIYCPKHGFFFQWPDHFLYKHCGCPKCSNEALSKKKSMGLDKFIHKARAVHGEKYDYSLVEYKNTVTKIKIICPIHGEFWQAPRDHLYGKQGCPKCGKIKSREKQRWSTERFVMEAKKVHGDLYDYSKVKYVDAKTPVEIVCSVHGAFFQVPDVHLRGCICRQCYNESRVKTQECFLEEMFDLYEDTLDFSKVIYVKASVPVEVFCKEHNHGTFYATPLRLLKGLGCPFCSGAIKNTATFVEDARCIHGDLYDYSKVKYINAKTKVEIICQEHGSFFVTPNKHLSRMQGCPKCASSKGETVVRVLLESRNTTYKEQKTFPNCRYKKPLKFDFYLPDHNFCIEYQGEHHYFPVRFSGMSQAEAEKRFEQQQIKDNIKRDYCKSNNIGLLEIPYWEFSLIETILVEQLGEVL